MTHVCLTSPAHHQTLAIEGEPRPSMSPSMVQVVTADLMGEANVWVTSRACNHTLSIERPATSPPLLQVVTADVMGEANVPAAPQMDMWGLGIVAFELMTAQRFFPPGKA